MWTERCMRSLFEWLQAVIIDQLIPCDWKEQILDRTTHVHPLCVASRLTWGDRVQSEPVRDCSIPASLSTSSMRVIMASICSLTLTELLQENSGLRKSAIHLLYACGHGVRLSLDANSIAASQKETLNMFSSIRELQRAYPQEGRQQRRFPLLLHHKTTKGMQMNKGDTHARLTSCARIHSQKLVS